MVPSASRVRSTSGGYQRHCATNAYPLIAASATRSGITRGKLFDENRCGIRPSFPPYHQRCGEHDDDADEDGVRPSKRSIRLLQYFAGDRRSPTGLRSLNTAGRLGDEWLVDRLAVVTRRDIELTLGRSIPGELERKHV